MEKQTKTQKDAKKKVGTLVKGKSAHTEELVDHYWGSINYVFSLIKASEIKAGLILSFYGILLNIIYQNITAVLQDEVSNILILILLGIWMLCTIISIYFSVRCFIPKIEAQYDPNIFFFGDIISKFGTIHEFSQTFYNISLKEEELFDQLGQQIFIISKISAYKFKCVNLAIRFLAFGLFALLGASIIFTMLKFLFN
ncbi:hypothetical protein SAMN04488009_1545 [Maribacter sedimenticola]|uniref:Pycsar effector protein domain-containing protein n=1 Tax=Maribacter sedimenticola TaxID=228956 RepID=A0ABY1SFT2_9FLAO|nr:MULTISPECIES: Pycsar system effector family protein [Maribacter]TVZ14654.1 hypothetical protein JM81_0859 [Maribacter sp. MAR_2009_72]SNR41933.1 hypothetical protein SAMN04488009_1545 [Maribacter sedimenticola]